MESDRGERGSRHQPDLSLVLREHHTGRAARDRRGGGEHQVDGRHAEPGGDADAWAAGYRGLDEQKAHGADLHGDSEPGKESCDQRSRRVHELR